MTRSNSELQVITYGKKLGSYVMTIRQKSSKTVRQSYTRQEVLQVKRG